MISLANIDQLIQAGLGNVKELAYWRIIMTDPVAAVTNMVYRSLTIRLFGRLCHYILTDPILYNRFRQLLLAEGNGVREEVDQKATKTVKTIKKVLRNEK